MLWSLIRCSVIVLMVFGDSLLAQTRSTVKGYVPDPTNLLSCAHYLADPSVAAYVRLETEQRNAVKALINSSHGLLDNYISTDPEETIESLRLKKGVVLKEREDQLREILSPAEIGRLHQAAFRMEIATLGFGNSVAIGFFGDHLEIDEGTRSSIAEEWKQISKDLDREIAACKQEYWQLVLKILTDDQVSTFKALIGKPFDFHEDDHAKFKKLKLPFLPNRYLPNPEEDLDLSVLLLNQSVSEELKLSEDQIDQIYVLFRAAGGLLFRTHPMFNRVKVLDERRTELKKIVNQRKLDRLKTMGYQVEIHRLGLGMAIVAGYLGRALEVDEHQRELIQKELQKIVELETAEISKVKAVAEEKILKMMGKRARTRIPLLIGDSPGLPFVNTAIEALNRDQR